MATETRTCTGHAGHGTESSGGSSRLSARGDFWPHAADLRANPLASPDRKGGDRDKVRPAKTLGIAEEVLAAEFCGDPGGRGGGRRPAGPIDAAPYGGKCYFGGLKTTLIGALVLFAMP